jgi:hypothetical protein
MLNTHFARTFEGLTTSGLQGGTLDAQSLNRCVGLKIRPLMSSWMQGS